MTGTTETTRPATVAELIPGCEVDLFGERAIFVARVWSHPLWPHLCMVIWRMPDGSWSHDALDPRQEVGDMLPATDTERQERLRGVLLGGAEAVARKHAMDATRRPS